MQLEDVYCAKYIIILFTVEYSDTFLVTRITGTQLTDKWLYCGMLLLGWVPVESRKEYNLHISCKKGGLNPFKLKSSSYPSPFLSLSTTQESGYLEEYSEHVLPQPHMQDDVRDHGPYDPKHHLLQTEWNYCSLNPLRNSMFTVASWVTRVYLHWENLWPLALAKRGSHLAPSYRTSEAKTSWLWRSPVLLEKWRNNCRCWHLWKQK